MKSPSPYKLLITGSLLVSVTSAALCFLVLSMVNGLNYWCLVLFTVIIFLSTYIIFRLVLKRYIYDRIKLIYKNIHTLKVAKDFKEKNVDLRDDVVNKVNEDVANWAEEHKKEIDELKQMEAYRREFLGNVSHELKTPIFNIQGYILTLLDGALDDVEVNKIYLQKTEKNIERIINIVQDLEVISRLESGEMKPDMAKFDIVSLTREIFDMLELNAQKKNIRLVFHDSIDDDSHISVIGDREKIRQVLINLIENSIKYGDEGGRTKVSFYDMDENILCEVSDNGIGIEANHLPRLFERFYRVDKSRSRNQGGSGLGLAIVKHIIESHQQSVNVRSAPGVGSTFSFTLKKG
jgi:two-component system phosphate regulon sensor histidine kinase PhoR